MRGSGAFAAIERLHKVLAEDVEALVRSENYKERLVQCLLEPYDRRTLADFLVLDNICRDLRILIGEEDTATLWEARKQAFEEACRAAISLDGKDWGAGATHTDSRRLRNVLLNVLSVRTPDDAYEQIEVGLK